MELKELTIKGKFDKEEYEMLCSLYNKQYTKEYKLIEKEKGVKFMLSDNNGRLQKMPCIPNTTMPWMLAKMNTLVGGKPALLDSSKLMCMWCGVITFEK